MKIEFSGEMTTDIAGVMKDFIENRGPATDAGLLMAPENLALDEDRLNRMIQCGKKLHRSHGIAKGFNSRGLLTPKELQLQMDLYVRTIAYDFLGWMKTKRFF